MRIIVAGSRTFWDRRLLFQKLDKLTRKLDRKKLTILHGNARGADKLADDWCFERMIRCERYRPDWETYGKAAGPIRNEEMAQQGEVLVAFWDGVSDGTADMIRRARSHGLKVVIVRF